MTRLRILDCLSGPPTPNRDEYLIRQLRALEFELVETYESFSPREAMARTRVLSHISKVRGMLNHLGEEESK